jgi:hypothetical protein
LNVAQRTKSFVKITLQLLRFAVQLGSAFVVGVLYYLVAMAPAVLDGVESFIGQPVVGVVFSAVAVGSLWILGLPFRFVPSLHSWWLRRWWMPFILGMVAVAFSVVSWLPRFQVMMHHPELQTEVPCFNPWMGYGGWLLAVFSVLHFYFPLPLDRIADVMTRVSGRLLGRPGPTPEWFFVKLSG